MSASNADSTLSFHLLRSAKQDTYPIPTLVCQLSGIHIIRTLDPEDEHQVSLARVFQAAGLTMIDGLLRFKLVRNIDYHTQLGFAGPNLLEIWTTVSRARTIVASLWLEPPSALKSLLAPAIDPCFSFYDQTRLSLLHNWRLVTISRAAYSTSLLLDSVFRLRDIQLLEEKSSWIRTGLPEIQASNDTQDSLDVALLEWTIEAAERHLYGSKEQQMEDRWTPVISILQNLMHIGQSPASSKLLGNSSYTNSLEVDLLAMCERMARQSSRLINVSTSRTTPSAAASRGPCKSISTQTELPQPLPVTMSDISCQTDISVRASPIYTNLVLVFTTLSLLVAVVACSYAYII